MREEIRMQTSLPPAASRCGDLGGGREVNKAESWSCHTGDTRLGESLKSQARKLSGNEAYGRTAGGMPSGYSGGLNRRLLKEREKEGGGGEK